jgi:hypothetical protein
MINSVKNLFLLFLFEPVISFVVFPYYAPEIFSIITVVIFFIFLFNSEKKIIILKEDYIITFYFIYLIFWSYSNDRLFSFSIPTSITHYFFSYLFVQIPILRIIIRNSKIDDKFIGLAIKIIKGTILLSLFVSLMQVINIDFLNPIKLRYNSGDSMEEFEKISMLEDVNTSRRPSIFAYYDNNGAGFSFMPLFSLFLGHLLMTKKNSLINIFFILASLIVLILTNTRYIIFGSILILMQIIFTSNNSKISSILKFGSILILILVSSFVLFDLLGYSLDTYFKERLFSESSNNSRVDAYTVFLIFFPPNWLLGLGVHVNDEIIKATGGVESIHIGYLSHLVEFGTVGTILLVLYYYRIIKNSFVKAKASKYFGTYFAFLFFLWANISLVNYTFFYPGFVIALLFEQYYSTVTKKI